MSTSVLFVSVNQSFRSTFTLAELEPWVSRSWAMTVAKAMTCDRVVAVVAQKPVGCWRLRGAFPTSDMFDTTGGPRPRIGLSLGEALPILGAYTPAPVLRRGSATQELDVEPLLPERDESLLG